MSHKKRPHASRKPVTDRNKEHRFEECEEALEEVLRERLEPGASFRDYERTLLEIAHEVVRRKLEKKLTGMEAGFANRLVIDHTNDWHGLREGTVFAYRRHAHADSCMRAADAGERHAAAVTFDARPGCTGSRSVCGCLQ